MFHNSVLHTKYISDIWCEIIFFFVANNLFAVFFFFPEITGKNQILGLVPPNEVVVLHLMTNLSLFWSSAVQEAVLRRFFHSRLGSWIFQETPKSSILIHSVELVPQDFFFLCVLCLYYHFILLLLFEQGEMIKLNVKTNE